MSAEPFRRVPYADRCLDCLTYLVLPLARFRVGEKATGLYRCPCGAVWVTSWSVPAVEGAA